MNEQEHCESPVKEIAHEIAHSKRERALLVKTLCECVKIISYGIAVGVLLGTTWFAYDYVDQKINSSIRYVRDNVNN